MRDSEIQPKADAPWRNRSYGRIESSPVRYPGANLIEVAQFQERVYNCGGYASAV